MLRCWFWTLLALGALAPASANPETAPRPRLCLVLSGGGALGIAHVGVLEVLEELRVPVDCIAGTSVGAVMGGLYAAGYSPAELADLVARLDWPALMTDEGDRPRRPYRNKLDDLTYLARGEFGLTRKGLTTPPGLVAGHRLGTELRLLALRVNGIRDFDQLPIPFRATATDIETGELVVLDHGELAAALRASMSVPGLLAPVQADGRWLVDGASVANLPVAPAKDLGAEVIVGVDLGQPLATRERPKNLVEVLSRTLDFSTRLNAEQVIPEVSVLIRPAVTEFGMFDFQDIPSLLERGREAARAQAEALRAYAVDEPTWQAYLARRQTPSPPISAPIMIRQVTLETGRPRVAGALAAKLRTRPGATLDPEALRQDLDQLWQLGEFATVEFTLEALPEGGWSLLLRGTPGPVGPSTLRFGVALTSDLEGISQFEALASWRRAHLNALDGDLRVAVEVGETPVVRAEIYQPLAASRVPFIALGVAGASAKLQLPVAGSAVQYRRFLTRAALDLGVSFGQYGELRAGVRHDDTRERATSDAPSEAPRLDREDAGFRLALTLDQLDRVNFPSRGYLTTVELYRAEPSLGADERYRRLDVTAVAAASHDRHRWIGLLRGSSALGGTFPAAEQLQLGGLFRLSGSPPGEPSGNYGGVLTSIYLYQLGRRPTFVDGLYVGFSLEVGNAWETAAEVSSGDLRRSFAVVFGADTLLGPVYLAHGQTTGGKDSFYLYLGRTF